MSLNLCYLKTLHRMTKLCTRTLDCLMTFQHLNIKSCSQNIVVDSVGYILREHEDDNVFFPHTSLHTSHFLYIHVFYLFLAINELFIFLIETVPFSYLCLPLPCPSSSPLGSGEYPCSPGRLKLFQYSLLSTFTPFGYITYFSGIY